jgi:hypothetical protein
MLTITVFNHSEHLKTVLNQLLPTENRQTILSPEHERLTSYSQWRSK